MVNRTTTLIRVKKDIAERLFKLKKEGETYSEVINKLLDK